MLKPTLDEFRRLAASATLVPVCREHLADMETPVSVLSRFADDDYVFLLSDREAKLRLAAWTTSAAPHPLTILEGLLSLVRRVQRRRAP